MKKLLFLLLISSAGMAQVVNAPKIPNVTIQRLRSDVVSFSVRFQQDGVNLNIASETFKCDFLEGGASVVRVSLTEGEGIVETDSATLTITLTAPQVALLARESYRYRLYTVSGSDQTTKLQGNFSLLSAIVGGATSIVPPTIIVNYTYAGSSNVGGYVGPSLTAGNALTISGGGGSYTIGVNYGTLDGRYAALSHTQAIGTVTGLQSALDTKVDAAGVRATTLTGLSTASATAVTSADNILAATGKLQAQATSNRQVADLAFLEAGTTADAEAKPILSPDNPPLYLFSVNNNTATKARQVVNTLYLDNLFNSNTDVTIDGRGSAAINPVLSGSKIINLISSTYDIVSTAINNLVTAVASVTAQVRYMPIGDSITADEHLDVSGNNRDYWNYSSKAVYNILRDRVDASNAFAAPVLIGHGNFKTRSFTYKGNSLTNRGGNAAQSGWAGSNYLYHASRLTGIVTGLSGFVPPDVSYHLLGLQTAGNGAWAATTAQQELIRTTIQGKNTCDKNATLYNWMKVQPGWGGANDTYTGSGTQHTNMDTFATYLLDNPGNPFYSKTKAQTGGSTNAFSLTTYLSRYKTLADDGTTRLTVGSTAGTLVSNATAYDVCTPTHVTISFGENDFYLFPATTATQVATVMRTIANVIATEYPAIKIGLLTNPRPGTNFPKLFPDGVRYAKSTTLTKSQLRNALITNLGVTSSVTKASGTSIYYVPTYEVTYPLSHMFDTYAETAGAQIDMEETVISTSHLGLDAQASLGDAVYAWLYYSMFN